MSFCFGFISNDAAQTACALLPFRAGLTLAEGAPYGWGLGYYQAGQPLLRKQPKPLKDPLDFHAVASNLRTNLLIGHVRSATVGGTRTENTHPFRFRNWIFCHSGTIDRFEAIQEDMLRSIPDFLRRNIRGNTDSEHLFHLFLSFLNDTGRIDDPRIPPRVAAEALASTMSYLDRLVTDRGGAPQDGCCIVSQGECLLGYRRGIELKVARQTSYTCQSPQGKQVAMPHLKTVVLAAGSIPELPGWELVADRTFITVDNQFNIVTTTP
jgi:predicted glutamine amidotransferase